MNTDDNISITVLLAGKPFPLRVNPQEEHHIRKVAKDVNELLTRFQNAYPNKDKQDYLAMALLTYAVDLQRARQNQPPTTLENRIDELLELVEQLIA